MYLSWTARVCPLKIRMSNEVLTHNVMGFGSENFGRQLGLDEISVLIRRGGKMGGLLPPGEDTASRWSLASQEESPPWGLDSLHRWAFSASRAVRNKFSYILPFSPCPHRQHQYLFLSSSVSSWDYCNNSPCALPHRVLPLPIHSP